MLALKRMVDGDRYCIDIITQTSAIRHGLSKIEDILLADHLTHCAREQMTTGQVEKATNEILTVYKLQRT
jgi:DNA-binding FrmR family transcriptional regulator